MKKHLLTSILALCVISTVSSAAMAANKFTKELKGIGSQVGQDVKSVGKDIKTSVKKDVDNAVAVKKSEKIAQIQKIKNEKLKPLDEKIAAKKAEIAAVKASTLTETEKTAKLAVLTRQLKYLQTQRANIEKTYNNKINALKK